MHIIKCCYYVHINKFPSIARMFFLDINKNRFFKEFIQQLEKTEETRVTFTSIVKTIEMNGEIDDLPLRMINKFLETPELFEHLDNFKNFFKYYERCSKVIRSTYSPAYLLKQLCLNENMNIFKCYQKYGTSASRKLFMISCMLNKCVFCIHSKKNYF